MNIYRIITAIYMWWIFTELLQQFTRNEYLQDYIAIYMWWTFTELLQQFTRNGYLQNYYSNCITRNEYLPNGYSNLHVMNMVQTDVS